MKNPRNAVSLLAVLMLAITGAVPASSAGDPQQTCEEAVQSLIDVWLLISNDEKVAQALADAQEACQSFGTEICEINALKDFPVLCGPIVNPCEEDPDACTLPDPCENPEDCQLPDPCQTNPLHSVPGLCAPVVNPCDEDPEACQVPDLCQNPDGCAPCPDCSPVGAHFDANPGPDGISHGTGYAVCRPVSGLCAATVVAFAAGCVKADGDFLGFPVDIEVCVEAASAACGSVATTITRSLEQCTAQAGFVTYKCEINPVRCDEVDSDWDVSQSCAEAQTIFAGAVTGDVYTCFKYAAVVGDDFSELDWPHIYVYCGQGHASALAENDLGPLTVPDAEGNRCDAQAEDENRAQSSSLPPDVRESLVAVIREEASVQFDSQTAGLGLDDETRNFVDGMRSSYMTAVDQALAADFVTRIHPAT